MKKKPKVVMIGGIPITPMSAAERKRLNLRIKKRHDKLRRKYPEVHGKKVDWIEYNYDGEWLNIGVRFTDGKYFSLSFVPTILTKIVEFSDMKSGNEEVLRTYYHRKDEDS